MSYTKGLVLSALLACSSALASQPKIENIETYLADQKELRASIVHDRKYQRLPSQEKTRLTEAQDRIFGTLQGKSSLDEMDAAQREQVLADQTVIDRVVELAQTATGERMVCKRGKRLGSNFMTSICKTQREWENIAEESRNNLENSKNNIQLER